MEIIRAIIQKMCLPQRTNNCNPRLSWGWELTDRGDLWDLLRRSRRSKSPKFGPLVPLLLSVTMDLRGTHHYVLNVNGIRDQLLPPPIGLKRDKSKKEGGRTSPICTPKDHTSKLAINVCLMCGHENGLLRWDERAATSTTPDVHRLGLLFLARPLLRPYNCVFQASF